MKVKDLERTANVAWSPKERDSILLAAGTAAQQVDATFSTNAALEIYTLNLTEPSLDMKLEQSVPSEHRFHKILWSNAVNEEGTIVAGCDAGLLQVFDASKLLKGEKSGLVSNQKKHNGPVHAMDFNPFQQNLIATGASDSEIFIWDLNNMSSPMTPGTKSQPQEDVLSLSWNRQVQHILASTFASKCVIWDLRKNEPIIKLTDTVSRVRWKVVAWHPEVATQLCLASEEDNSPVIQIWDLRFATSPLKTLESHQRGILALAWCQDDSDLLVSCGKDNKILCWNPNSNQTGGEVLAEVYKTNQWNFDVAWCPKNPAIIACPSFDGHVSVYSLSGGKTQQFQTSNKIADSFPGMDEYAQAPVPQANARVSVDLSKPPKWFRRPVGASFAFGGKLISFDNNNNVVPNTTQYSSEEEQHAVKVNRTVQISQVITEPDLVQKSTELEQALEFGNFIEYCQNKSQTNTNEHKKNIWRFLRANFEENSRAELLNLLGYKIEDVNNQLNQIIGKNNKTDFNGLTDQFSSKNRIEDFDSLGNIQKDAKPIPKFKIKTDNDTEGLITQALLLGNVEAAAELCFQAERYADALIIAMCGAPDLFGKIQQRYLDQSKGYVSSLIAALATENWSAIINNCDITSWKEALAATLTHASDDDLLVLCEQLGNRLEQESAQNKKLGEDAQLCYICSGSFEKLVTSWSDKTLSSTQDLQELVELVTFLQKSVERQGRQVQVSGSLAELLTRYALLLASQGNLKTALTYLGTSTNQKLSSVRDRLYVSLGQKPAYAQHIRQQQSRRSSQRQSFTSHPQPQHYPTVNQFAAPPPFVPPQPAQQGVYNPQNFNTGLPNANSGLAQSWQQAPFEPPRTFSPAPPVLPPTQPPRPPSTNSNTSGISSGLPSRKYILDPSVTSNQYGGQFQQRTQPLPMQPMVPYQNAAPSPFTAQPMSNMGSLPQQPLNVLTPTPLAPVTAPTFGNSYGGPPLPQSVQPASDAAQGTYSSSPGWNDPPILNKAVKPPPKLEATLKVDPITHPIYGAAPVQPVPMNNGYGDPNPLLHNPYNQAPAFNPDVSQFQPQNPIGVNQNLYQNPSYPPNTGTNFPPANFNQNVGAQPPQALRAEKPAPVQKPPIPEEHIHMQTVFDELKNKCSCVSNNPQTKRKLEDVGRKLETLYDLLREYKLSANTLASLHQLVQLIQNGDYTGGLNLHTQLVSGSDFSQIASFMPGIKVLLQCALQLQVYLR